MASLAIGSGRRAGTAPGFGAPPTVPGGTDTSPPTNGGGASPPKGTVKPQDFPFPLDPTIISATTISLLLNIFHTINNTIDISNNIDDAINSSITHTADAVAGAFNNVAGTLVDGLKGFVSNLGDFVNNAFGSLGDTLSKAVSGIADTLGTLLGDVFNGVKDAIAGLGSFLGDIAGAIRESLVAIVNAIHENGAQAILPLLNLLVTAIADIKGVIAAFDNDIKGGIQSLLLLPGQLKDSLGSLEAALQRALQEIGFKQGAKIDSDVSFGDKPLPSALTQSITQFLNPRGLPSNPLNTFDAVRGLLSACDPSALRALSDPFKLEGLKAPDWLQHVGNMLLGLLTEILRDSGVFANMVKLGLEEGDKACPIKKLDPSDAVQATIRHYITDAALKDELNAQGYSDTRVGIFKQLASILLDTATVLDANFRGILSDSELSNRLGLLGHSQENITILKAQAHAIPTVNDVLRWKDHKVIDETTARGLLAVLRYTSEFIDKIFQTYQASESVQEELVTYGRKQASGLGFLASTFGAVTPPEVLAAAEREQVTPGNARLQWLAHWALPSYLAIIQSYFRNLRTIDTVHNVMRSENIPEEFWDELIQIQRPLIPFRSMGALVNDGIMSEGEAILELSAHGFDALHIKWFLELFKKQKKSVNSVAVGTISALSIQTAKQLFAEGIITEDQYIQVLIGHKYDPAVAKLQADAEALAIHTKQRKVQIETFVEDVLLGLMTVDDALAKLHQGGFTANEILSFQTKVRKQAKVNEKHPSIAEMRLFIKAGIIDLKQFKNELTLQGWIDPWLNAWIELETPAVPLPATP
jgi:hypothetical protein